MMPGWERVGWRDSDAVISGTAFQEIPVVLSGGRGETPGE